MTDMSVSVCLSACMCRACVCVCVSLSPSADPEGDKGSGPPWKSTSYVGRGSYMVWEINMGVCPLLKFDNIMFINCLGYDFYI